MVRRALAGGLLLLAAGAASAQPIGARDLVEMRMVSGIAVSPDGMRAVVRINSPSVDRNDTAIEWWLVDTAGVQPPRRLGGAGEPILEGQAILNETPIWAPDGTAFYYRARRGQEIQVWRMDVASGAAAPVTSDAADVLRFTVAADGTSITYWTGPTRAQILAWEAEEDRVGVLYDDTIWPWAGVARNWLVGGRMATYRRYSVTEAGTLGSRAPQIARRIDLASGAVSDAPPAPPAPPRLDGELGRVDAPDGRAAAVILRDADGLRSPPFKRLSVLLPGRKAPKRCAATACLSQQLSVLGWRGREIVFAAEPFAVGQAGLYGWDVRADRVRRIVQTDGLLGALADNDRYWTRACPMTARAAVCTFASARTPPRVEAISLADGGRRVILDPNPGLGGRVTGVTVEHLTWSDRFGRATNEGVLVLPADLRPGVRHPLVITLYRCRGFLTGSAGDGAPEYVMARLGFAVLCVEFNNEAPKVPMPADSYVPARYPAGLAQMEGAIDALDARGLIDRTRVGVTGLSMGGNLASYAMSHSKLFAAAVLRHAAVFEPEYPSQLGPGSALREALLRDYHVTPGSPERDKAWADVSASLRADRIDTATLIEANDNEHLASLPMFSAMKDAGKPVEMHVFPNETHQLREPVHRVVNYDRTVDWLRFWLQGHEDPDPAKAAQYARWRALPKLAPKP